ncbi:MAG: hypothetical protein R2780_04710 [Crocinitomicaceae bacterium]|nr:hypothetical protein [Crocinitomicaceae bacterium]
MKCNKAGQMMEQQHFEKLSWWGKRKLRIHLYVCKVCKCYHEDDQVLSKVIKMAGNGHTDKCISDDEKSKMKDHLANQIS